MFIGHFAMGLGAKKFAPNVSLGILFLACQLADFIWPNLVLLGIESVKIEPGITALTPFNFVHYPYSHSLLAVLIWAALFGALYQLLSRAGTKAALVVGVLVLSHWLLDAVTHRPDLPLTFESVTFVGAGLWNYPAIAITLEVLLFAAGAWLYARHTKPLNRQGSIGFWALLVFLIAVYAANFLGPLPPSSTAVAWSAQALWLIVFWGFWIDRNRVAVTA